MSQKCDHHFICKSPGVRRLLEVFMETCNDYIIVEARAKLKSCPYCRLEFYKDILPLLKDFVSDGRKRKSVDEGTADLILPWALSRLGYSYREIHKKLDISLGTVKDRVYLVMDFLIEVEETFWGDD